MSLEYQNYINGRWQDARSGDRFSRENPATGEITGSYPQSSAEDIADAVCAASEAERDWRRTPAPKRAEILYRAAEILVRKKEDFARELTEEMGKVIAEARGDVQEAIDMTYYMAGEGRRLYGQTTPAELPDKFAMSVRAPIGVVGLITPWNFPMAIPSWKIAPALVAGNTVVFKPSQFAPKSAMNYVRTLEEAGLPPGVLNLVHGEGAVAGSALIEHPLVKMISFTGSNAVGQQIAIKCAELGKQVALEMGGKNAITILDDADLDLALDGAIWSAFGTTGQRCTAASRIIVQAGVHDSFADMLVERARNLRLGNGLDDATEVGPLVNKDQLGKVVVVHARRPRRGRDGRRRRDSRGRRRPRRRLLLPADHLRQREAGHAHRAGGDLRPGDRAHQGALARRGDRREQRREVRPLRLHLHRAT